MAQGASAGEAAKAARPVRHTIAFLLQRTDDGGVALGWFGGLGDAGRARVALLRRLDLDGEAVHEPTVQFREMTVGEAVVEDYVALRLTLRSHPVALLRYLLTP